MTKAAELAGIRRQNDRERETNDGELYDPLNN